MLEAVIYPVLFITLYFEVFMLVTFLSKDARDRRNTVTNAGTLPTVAIVVPCYNEATTVHGTVRSLKALDYPTDLLSIVVVNDGSTDGTAEALAAYAGDPQVAIVHQENGGKHTALNRGIASTHAEFVGCLDADSFVDPKALRLIIPRFADERVGAVTASLSVHKPSNLIQRMQHAEYVLGMALRHILSAVNGLYVTPGPFSIYRRSTLATIGGFRAAHQTEDMEIALRMQREGWKIENAPRALVFTKAPRTVRALLKQRTRWTSGFLRNAVDYRSLFGNPRYGTLGLLVLPLAAFSVVAGASLFIYGLFELARELVNAVWIQGDVPVSYLFQSPHLDWFFFPVTALSLIALTALAAAATLIALGERISGVPERRPLGVVWYILLSTCITPLWLIRSLSDVSLGVKRSWR